ncbi:MAG: AbrB/MazE/SpoVT family DNA-binding domain-containing protein [Clostridia bacterium]|nr:AbrB/MazE/SpoVT family DNA-binding domain-containing protein [Clostridia bacterium]
MEMKATGIVRRIDDLGRVVIPKEIRRTMRIREGDPLEIFTNKDGEVIFKKYSAVGELANFATQYADALYKISGHNTAITDTDSIICAAGVGKKELIEKNFSSEIETVLKNREPYFVQTLSESRVHLLDHDNNYLCGAVIPILSEGDIIGSVVLYSTDVKTVLGDTEKKLATTAATVLGKLFE